MPVLEISSIYVYKILQSNRQTDQQKQRGMRCNPVQTDNTAEQKYLHFVCDVLF